MRATSPSGAVAYEGRPIWSADLGYGVRPAEQGQAAHESLAVDPKAEQAQGHDS
jgi:hypothetical protein